MIRDKKNMIKCIFRVFGSNTINYSMNYFTLLLVSLQRPQALFSEWILSKIITIHSFAFFISSYSGCRRLFLTDYCRTLWKIILFTLLVFFIATAGTFFLANILNTLPVWVFSSDTVRGTDSLRRCHIYIYIYIYIYIWYVTGWWGPGLTVHASPKSRSWRVLVLRLKSFL